jgi:hypothetical protein
MWIEAFRQRRKGRRGSGATQGRLAALARPTTGHASCWRRRTCGRSGFSRQPVAETSGRAERDPGGRIVGFGAVDAYWWLERKKPRCTSIEYDTPEAGTDLDLDVVLMVDSVFSLINVSGGRLMASGCRIEQDLCICQPGWQHSSSPSPA